MPKGMLLRSGRDWHLDPAGTHTMDHFLDDQGRTRAEAEPVSLALYLDYVAWLLARKGVVADPTYVARLDHGGDAGHPFLATLQDGRLIRARRVVLALGFCHGPYYPTELVARLPAERVLHCAEFARFDDIGGQRILIVGGRQSAFEWAALLREAGAAEVHVVHRGATPAFTASDWSWVDPLVERFVSEPGWFARLAQAEREALGGRFYAEGRLKLEPWLEARVMRDGISLWPRANIAAAELQPDGAVAVRLDTGETLAVDQVALATGFRPQVDQVPFLAAGNILPALPVHEGCPVLDSHMQTGLPGLFITSYLATQDFGPFFAFTVSARASARLIGQALMAPPARPGVPA